MIPTNLSTLRTRKNSDKLSIIRSRTRKINVSTLCSVGNTKVLLSSMKMQFVSDLCKAYQKTLSFLYDNAFQSFYTVTSVHIYMSGTGNDMASVKHAVDVKKESVVDMKTFQFNYKNLCVVTQQYLVSKVCAWF